MLSHGKAGKRYAKALFDLAGTTGQVDRIRADIEGLQDALVKSPELTKFMKDYMLPAASRARAIAALFSGKVAPLTLSFLKLIEEKKRCGILDQICAAFIDRHDQMLGLIKGQITSPFELDPAGIQLVTAFAQAKTKGRLKLSSISDPALIGGFRLRLGDVVYDASTAAQLHMLKEKMINV